MDCNFNYQFLRTIGMDLFLRRRNYGNVCKPYRAVVQFTICKLSNPETYFHGELQSHGTFCFLAREISLRNIVVARKSLLGLSVDTQFSKTTHLRGE